MQSYDNDLLYIDRHSLLGLYLYIYASKNSFSRIILTNNFLRIYFEMNDKERVTDDKLNELKNKLSFYFSGIGCVDTHVDQQNKKVLTLDTTNRPFKKDEINLIPSEEEMCKFIGLKRVSISIH